MSAWQNVEPEMRRQMLARAAAYSNTTGVSLRTIGGLCMHDHGFFSRLKDESKSFTVRTFDEVMAWFDVNWPAEVAA